MVTHAIHIHYKNGAIFTRQSLPGKFYPLCCERRLTIVDWSHAIDVAGVTSLSRDNKSRLLSRSELFRRSSSLMDESRDSSPRLGEEVASRHSEDDRFVWVPANWIPIVQTVNESKLKINRPYSSWTYNLQRRKRSTYKLWAVKFYFYITDLVSEPQFVLY